MLRNHLLQRKSLILKVAVLVVIIVMSVFLVAWIGGFYPRRLRPGEITDYQGTNLSAIDDFSENSIKGPQQVSISNYTLTLTGLVNRTKTYTYNDVLNSFQHYEKVVTLHCVEGWDVTILWEGILMKDLLNDAGIDASTSVVIFYSVDGYSTSLPLSFILNNNILMAYKMNGLVLPRERGFPFQLVAESKYGYKWIKWINRIDLSGNSSFRGYWESRGFNNDATVP